MSNKDHNPDKPPSQVLNKKALVGNHTANLLAYFRPTYLSPWPAGAGRRTKVPSLFPDHHWHRKNSGRYRHLTAQFRLLKEWAYAGLFFAMAGALFSHLAVGDYAAKAIAGPSFQLLFIALSWYFRPADRKIVPNSL